MNAAPAFPATSLHRLLKFCGLALACTTIILEIVSALTLPHDELWIVTLIGITFGLIMLVLWSVRLSQKETVQSEMALSPDNAYREARTYNTSYPSTPAPYYQDFPPNQPTTSPEPVADVALEKKYQDEHGVQGYKLAKGNEPQARSQDAFDLNNDLRRYAVTDGVSRSFLPSYWAAILANRFVYQGQGLEEEAYFAEWLGEGCKEWEQKAHKWIARAEKRRQEQGLIDATDWQHYLTLGAQSTLIGCTLLPTTHNGAMPVQIIAVGDANFFQIRHTHNGTWEYAAYPCADPSAFGATPDALATAAAASSKGMQRTWSWIGRQQFNAYPGDYLLLATDAMAKWLLQQLQTNQEDWRCLLDPNTSHSDLAHLVFTERAAGRLEDDDVTVLVIPL